MLEQLTVLAPGLLGGSVARASRARGAARRIVIWARRPETRHALASQPWCSSAPAEAADAVAGAELVVIASPVDRIIPLLRQVAPSIASGGVVCDVGSVKGEVSRLGHEVLAGKAHFIGCHPMAGSEKTGWENSREDLFEGRTCFVTPVPGSDEKAAAKVSNFWADLGAEVVTVAPDRHDEIVAHISHLPQVLASSLCAFLAARDPSWRNYAGGGLRDTTRIAGSDPKLWKAVLEENRDEVLRALGAFQDELQGMHAALANRDYAEVAARLERGRAYRDKFRPAP
ncbi:MAG TPA: prephenate dehydrogenase/arogenate dehydrogenase family protein [Opitutaceae bacterium]|jgi:prephenate dehydrogenase